MNGPDNFKINLAHDVLQILFNISLTLFYILLTLGIVGRRNLAFLDFEQIVVYRIIVSMFLDLFVN